MTDSPRPGSPSEPTDPYAYPYQGYSDPAYAGGFSLCTQLRSAGRPVAHRAAPTVLDADLRPAGRSAAAGAGPEGSQTPRWLWIAAGAAIVIVLGLVAALIITNTGSDNRTVAAPDTTSPQSTPTRTTAPTTETLPGLPFPIPQLPLPTAPDTTGSTAPGETEPVVYEVDGDGRAINITYVDTGSVLQTEFNVMLPWRKEADLPKPAKESASVTVVNVGSDVTCSISIAGAQVKTQTGAGLTICSPFG